LLEDEPLRQRLTSNALNELSRYTSKNICQMLENIYSNCVQNSNRA
jgi:glycosyltransferase involved in cell wall biosynthesis